MITKATLPEAFRPLHSEFLVRLGRDNDGGYLIDSRDLVRSSALISFGVNEDWSFERQFFKSRQLPVFAYDATLNFRYLFRRAWRSFVRLNPIAMIRSFSALVDYPIFFSGMRKHYRQYIGLESVSGYGSLSSVLAQVRAQSGIEAGIFLKIDIEGWEYRIFEELIKHGDKFSGLAIELHDVDIHIERLVDFIRRFPLRLVHVHANNYAPINAAGVPLAIECTFSASCDEENRKVVSLPHALDMPNKRNRQEIALSFA